jgi:DNA-binding transcriptional LysR family regulator
MIELRLIRYALALGKHGNFSRAAHALRITQPTLTRSIRALERLVDVRLFDRSHKGVTPTAHGRVLLQRGETVLNRESDLRRELRLLSGLEEGSLTVSAGPYLAETTVAAAVARVARANPGLMIKCTSADPAEVVRDVLGERTDVGIAAIDGLENDERLVVEPLPVKRIYFACRPGHPLTKEDSPSLARVLEFPLVTTLLRGKHAVLASGRGATVPADASQVPDFTPHIFVNSTVLARLIARESDAVFPGTAVMLVQDVAAGLLVRLDADAPAMRSNPGVFYLRNRTLAPAARTFIETLREVEEQAQLVEDSRPEFGKSRPMADKGPKHKAAPNRPRVRVRARGGRSAAAPVARAAKTQR